MFIHHSRGCWRGEGMLCLDPIPHNMLVQWKLLNLILSLPLCLSVSLSLCLSVCLFLCLSLSFFIHALFVSLSFYLSLFLVTYPSQSHHRVHCVPEQYRDLCKLHSEGHKGFGRLFGHFHILDIQNPCTVYCNLKN